MTNNVNMAGKAMERHLASMKLDEIFHLWHYWYTRIPIEG